MNNNSPTINSNIKIIDCTLRDGGLVNNFEFTDSFVKDLYTANIHAGIDYMEFGYKASKEIFSKKDYGKWKFCEEDDIRAIVGDNNSDMKISIMADAERTNYKNDIIQKNNSVIDLIRIATYAHQIPTAISMIEDAHNKGYETSVNIMAISKLNLEDLANSINLLAQTDVDTIYLVDSFGAFYPKQIQKLTDMYMEVATKYNKKVGIHTHNNQQLAFANTIEAYSSGASYLDATISGMGRGAGNCYMESLLAFLDCPKYDLMPIIDFAQKHISFERNKGNIWGYDIPYLFTGILNSHPSSAIKFINEQRTDYTNFYHELKNNIK